MHGHMNVRLGYVLINGGVMDQFILSSKRSLALNELPTEWVSGALSRKGPSTADWSTVTLRRHYKYSALRRIRTRDRSVRVPSDCVMFYVGQTGWTENMGRRWSRAERVNDIATTSFE